MTSAVAVARPPHAGHETHGDSPPDTVGSVSPAPRTKTLIAMTP
jgi:hypothetical protein